MGMAVSIPSSQINSDTNTKGSRATASGRWQSVKDNPLFKKCEQILSDRKKVYIYCILGFLGILILVNLALTFWLVTILRLGVHGRGPISFGNGGVQIRGSVFTTQNIYTNQLYGSPGGPLSILASRDIQLKSDKSALNLKQNAEIEAEELQIHDSQGRNILSASRDGIKANKAKLSASSITSECLQTSLVESRAGDDLVVETLTNEINIQAGSNINLVSGGGAIKLQAFQHITLKSKQGKIDLQGEDVRLKNIPIVNSTQRGFYNSQPPKFEIFQVCVCGSGKLFLAPTESKCSISSQFCK